MIIKDSLNPRRDMVGEYRRRSAPGPMKQPHRLFTRVRDTSRIAIEGGARMNDAQLNCQN